MLTLNVRDEWPKYLDAIQMIKVAEGRLVKGRNICASGRMSWVL